MAAAATDPGAVSPPIADIGGLWRAVAGLRDLRAIAAFGGCAVAGVLAVGLLIAASGGPGFFSGLLAFVVYVVALGTGINAAGVLHMDHARGLAQRSLGDALAFGLLCIPKLIALALLLFVVELAVFLVIAVLLLLCKIPFLGPLLFVAVLPVSVVLAGVAFAGISVCLALSLPALWQGAGVVRALGITLAIVRGRLVETLLSLLVVGFLGFVVSLIVFGVLGMGLLPTIAMSASIVSFGGMAFGDMAGLAGGGGGVGHAIAGGIGLSLLWAAAFALVSQVSLLGLCLVYLRVTEGLDLTAGETALRGSLDEARRRVTDLGERARSAAGATTDPATGASTTTPGAASTATMRYADDAPLQPTTQPSVARASSSPPPPSSAAGGAAAGFEPFAPHGRSDAGFGTPAAREPVDADIALPFDDLPGAATPAAPSPASTEPFAGRSGAAMPAAPMPMAGASTSTDPFAGFAETTAMPVVPPPSPAAAPRPEIPALPPTCPQCLSRIEPGDVFCGVCGFRLL